MLQLSFDIASKRGGKTTKRPVQAIYEVLKYWCMTTLKSKWKQPVSTKRKKGLIRCVFSQRPFVNKPSLRSRLTHYPTDNRSVV